MVRATTSVEVGYVEEGMYRLPFPPVSFVVTYQVYGEVGVTPRTGILEPLSTRLGNLYFWANLQFLLMFSRCIFRTHYLVHYLVGYTPTWQPGLVSGGCRKKVRISFDRYLITSLAGGSGIGEKGKEKEKHSLNKYLRVPSNLFYFACTYLGTCMYY